MEVLQPTKKKTITPKCLLIYYPGLAQDGSSMVPFMRDVEFGGICIKYIRYDLMYGCWYGYDI